MKGNNWKKKSLRNFITTANEKLQRGFLQLYNPHGEYINGAQVKDGTWCYSLAEQRGKVHAIDFPTAITAQQSRPELYQLSDVQKNLCPTPPTPSPSFFFLLYFFFVCIQAYTPCEQVFSTKKTQSVCTRPTEHQIWLFLEKSQK